MGLAEVLLELAVEAIDQHGFHPCVLPIPEAGRVLLGREVRVEPEAMVRRGIKEVAAHQVRHHHHHRQSVRGGADTPEQA